MYIAYSIAIILGISLCFAVGLEKKIFGKKTLIFTAMALILNSVLSSLYMATHYEFENFGIFINSIITNIIYLSPIITAFFLYLEKQKSYVEIKNPVLKIVSFYIGINFSLALAKLISLKNFLAYSVIDYIAIVSSIIVLSFFAGLIFDKKIPKNIFIKATALFCMASCLIPPHRYSEALISDLHIRLNYTFAHLPIFMLEILCRITIIFIICRYFFTKSTNDKS